MASSCSGTWRPFFEGSDDVEIVDPPTRRPCLPRVRCVYESTLTSLEVDDTLEDSQAFSFSMATKETKGEKKTNCKQANYVNNAHRAAFGS